MIAILIFSPTIITFAMMWGSILLGQPISLERVGWLLTDAQIVFLAVGAVAILLAKKSERAMPAWRISANKWIGRFMVAAGLLYAIASMLVAYHAP